MTRRVSTGAAGVTVALLAARNVGAVALPEGAYVPVNVVVGAVAVGIARYAGVTPAELGLGRRGVRRGLRTGAVAGGVAGAVMAVGAVLPLTRGFFEDQRVDIAGGAGELAHQTLLRIPVGTVLFEEVAFRGVLLALLGRRLGTTSAVLLNSALFGLWHVVPSLGAATANDITGPARVGAVAGAVLVTTGAGGLFCWLRVRSGHLLAPVLLHLGFNDGAYLLSWWVQS